MLKLILFSALLAAAAAQQSQRFGRPSFIGSEPVKMLTLSPHPTTASRFFSKLDNFVRQEGIRVGPLDEISTPTLMKKLTFNTNENNYINYLVPQQDQVEPRKLVKTIVEIPQQIDAAVLVVPLNQYYQEKLSLHITNPFLENRVINKQLQLLKKIGHVRHIITVIEKGDAETSQVPSTALNQLKNEIEDILSTEYYRIGSTFNPIVEVDAFGSNFQLREFVDTLDETVRNGRLDIPTKDDPFVFVIEEVQRGSDSQVVVFGKVLEGQIKVGESAVVMPDDTACSVVDIEKSSRTQVSVAEAGEKIKLYLTGLSFNTINTGDVVTKREVAVKHQVKDVQLSTQITAIVYVPMSRQLTRIYNTLPAFVEPGYEFQPQTLSVGQELYLDFYKGLYKVAVRVQQVNRVVDMISSSTSSSQQVTPGRLAVVTFVTTEEPAVIKEGLSFFVQPVDQQQTVICTGRVVLPERLQSLAVQPLQPLVF